MITEEIETKQDQMIEEEEKFSDAAPQKLSQKQVKFLFGLIGAVVIFGIIFLQLANKPKKTTASASVDTTAAPKYGYEEEVNAMTQPGISNEPMKADSDYVDRPTLMPSDAEEMYGSELPPETQSGFRPRSNTFASSGAPSMAAEYTLPATIKKRLNADYQQMVSHFKETKFLAGEAANTPAPTEELSNVEKPLQDLYEGAQSVGLVNKLILGAGTRLTLVTDQEVNSDHPGTFTATIMRPHELRGAKVLLESGVNVRDRIAVQPKALLWGRSETQLSGQVEMTYPGLEGQVKSHWAKRMGPAITNAAIGGGFLAWSLSGPSSGRVDTRDVVVSGVVEQSVTGVQNEVSRLGGDYPNTVKVAAGTEFRILIIQSVTVGN